MKKDTTFVRMRTGDHLGDAQMSKKRHLALLNLTFLRVAIDRNGFRKTKEEMTLLCGWHQIIGICREVEFSGCLGTRQCLGLRVTGIGVKVDRWLALFMFLCSSAGSFSREGMAQAWGITHVWSMYNAVTVCYARHLGTFLFECFIAASYMYM